MCAVTKIKMNRDRLRKELHSVRLRAEALRQQLARIQLGKTSTSWPQILGNFIEIVKQVHVLQPAAESLLRFTAVFPSSFTPGDYGAFTHLPLLLSTASDVSQDKERSTARQESRIDEVGSRESEGRGGGGAEGRK